MRPQKWPANTPKFRGFSYCYMTYLQSKHFVWVFRREGVVLNTPCHLTYIFNPAINRVKSLAYVAFLFLFDHWCRRFCMIVACKVKKFIPKTVKSNIRCKIPSMLLYMEARRLNVRSCPALHDVLKWRPPSPLHPHPHTTQGFQLNTLTLSILSLKHGECSRDMSSWCNGAFHQKKGAINQKWRIGRSCSY